MKDNYSFKNAIKNPYMAHLKHEVSIMLDDETLAFLNEQAHVQNIPYKTLASMYLSYCAKEHKDLVLPSPLKIHKVDLMNNEV